MSLPITGVVDVALLLAPKAKELASFGKLGFVTDETPLNGNASRITSYGDAAAVAADWSSNSSVVKAANAFYGNGGKDFMVILASSRETNASLLGGYSTDLAALQAITNGGFTISIDNSPQFVTGLDFSAATSLDEVAELLEVELTNARVTVVGGQFLIATYSQGQFSNISFATNDIGGAAAALCLTYATGAVVNKAEVAETPVAALMEAEDIDNTFYGIALTAKWRDTPDAEAVADYAEARRKVFFNTSNNPECLVANNSTNIMAKLKSKSMSRTLSHYSSKVAEYPSCAVAGRAFLVNFEGTNTTITLNLKVMAGVTVEKLRTSEHDALQKVNGNAVVDIAGMYVYSDSRMGDGTWFDAIHGTDWLQNRIETGVFNRLFSTTSKVPYTDTGVSILLAEVEQALRQGVTNGLLAPGNNSSGEYLPLGYRVTYIPTSQSAAADKSNRTYKGISFEAVGAGAMHRVVISGSFNE